MNTKRDRIKEKLLSKDESLVREAFVECRVAPENVRIAQALVMNILFRTDQQRTTEDFCIRVETPDGYIESRCRETINAYDFGILLGVARAFHDAFEENAVKFGEDFIEIDINGNEFSRICGKSTGATTLSSISKSLLRLQDWRIIRHKRSSTGAFSIKSLVAIPVFEDNVDDATGERRFRIVFSKTFYACCLTGFLVNHEELKKLPGNATLATALCIWLCGRSMSHFKLETIAHGLHLPYSNSTERRDTKICINKALYLVAQKTNFLIGHEFERRGRDTYVTIARGPALARRTK